MLLQQPYEPLLPRQQYVPLLRHDEQLLQDAVRLLVLVLELVGHEVLVGVDRVQHLGRQEPGLAIHRVFRAQRPDVHRLAPLQGRMQLSGEVGVPTFEVV